MNYKIKREKRELVAAGSVFRFYKDTMRLPDGKVEYWDYVDHKKGGGAAVVPVLPDGRILLIRQYRPAVDKETLELPAGAKNAPGEAPETAALRELREETGYGSEKVTKLLHLDTATSWCGETTDVYLAEGCGKEGAQELDEAEEVGIVKMALSDVLDLILSGRLSDSKTVAGILAYACREQRQKDC